MNDQKDEKTIDPFVNGERDDPSTNRQLLISAPTVDLAPISTTPESAHALLNPEISATLHTRWNEIQGKFVDDPRTAVKQADVLVTDVVEIITQMFASEHGSLESQWRQGSSVSTEDLRKALKLYRSFFNRLVV